MTSSQSPAVGTRATKHLLKWAPCLVYTPANEFLVFLRNRLVTLKFCTSTDAFSLNLAFDTIAHETIEDRTCLTCIHASLLIQLPDRVEIHPTSRFLSTSHKNWNVGCGDVVFLINWCFQWSRISAHYVIL